MQHQFIVLFMLPVLGIAALSIYGLSGPLEPWFWLGLAALAAWKLADLRAGSVILQALTLGLGWGLLNGLIQTLFFPQYLQNNPGAAAEFQQITFMAPRLFPIFSGLILGGATAGLIWGLVRLINFARR